ncbi:MAG: radical SAM protein [Deltaproteobacteria bacterium]|jgi:MoaA/NifB/PqqE/SkfB family radical SAM enzyme|nr:radical SAM protein [Deltaproteobacteria bacterium]
MAKFTKTLARGRQESERDPEAILARELGPRFMAYRKRFWSAELGLRPEIPLHLDVDVATVCQLGCPMCPAGREAGENPFPGFGLFLDEELYLSAVREAEKLGIPSIRLGLTGEPLLAPDMDLWVLEASKRGFLDIALITNGQLLDASLSERLIQAGLTRLMVSVDAVTEATYQTVRPGGDYARLLANLEAFLEVRERLGSRLPVLRLSFVVRADNQAEAAPFAEKFSGLADYLAFQDYLNVVGRPDTDLGLKPAKALPENAKHRCPDPLTRLAIHADGGLFPCCSDFGRLAPLGNLATHGLKEVWNSRRALVLAGSGGRLSAPCQACLKASGHLAPSERANGAGGGDGPGQGTGQGTGPKGWAGPNPRALAELDGQAGRPNWVAELEGQSESLWGEDPWGGSGWGKSGCGKSGCGKGLLN